MKLPVVSNPWTYPSISRILRVVAYSTETPNPSNPSDTLPGNPKASVHSVLNQLRQEAKPIKPNTLQPSPPTPNLSNPPDTLSGRVARSGNPKTSVLPVLNQWRQEGKPINPNTLQNIIRQLRSFRRYNHALEVLEYLSEEMKFGLKAGEMAIRLDLISKARGLDQAEKYFDSLPDTMRTFQVYGALLNCYVHHKCLDKAEATLEVMRRSGVPINIVSYNVMLNLYRHMGEHDKLDALVQEMKEKGVKRDAYTNNIRLNAYASSSDLVGMEKFLTKLENGVEGFIDWHAYVVAANAYLKAGLTEKASQMLGRAEPLINPGSRKYAYEVLLTIYANLGSKDDVYRIWKLYGNMGKFFNYGYLCMIGSLVKLDDFDGVEKIYAEWESGYSSYDPRIPTMMIAGYCKRGFVEKAEAYTNRLIERGVVKELDAFMLNTLASAYQLDGQMAKAVETMKAAISSSTSGWKPNIGALAACLKYLVGENKLEEAKELLELLKVRGHLSIDVYDRLVMNITDGNTDVTALLDQIKGVEETLDEESEMSHGGEIEASS